MGLAQRLRLFDGAGHDCGRPWKVSRGRRGRSRREPEIARETGWVTKTKTLGGNLPCGDWVTRRDDDNDEDVSRMDSCSGSEG